MRVLILHGANGPDPLLDKLAERLRVDFEVRKASVETVRLADVPMAWCQGCFECWTHTPGTCKIHDAGRDVAREFVQADAVLLLTPVHFGSYSSATRKALDRTLGMLLPFFHRLDGETHHAPRYEYPPALGVLAALDAPDADGEATVRALAHRNAINFSSPASPVVTIARTDEATRQFAACDELADALCAPHVGRPRITDVEAMLPTIPKLGAGTSPRRAMLLVGSSKPRGTSTSEALGLELMERLAMRGIAGTTRYVHKHAHEAHGIADLLAELRECDLLVVATPLYVDALPYLLTQVLEAVVSDRLSSARAPALSVAMIINCGFPEARHTAVARTIGGLFARDAGATWLGALPVGEGGAIAGRPLDELGKMAKHLAWAFDETARALAEGEAIPDSAVRRFQQPLIPQRVYTAAADLGWMWSAAHEGALSSLWERPDVAIPGEFPGFSAVGRPAAPSTPGDRAPII